MSARPRIVVVGAGVTGLSAAYHVASTRPGVEVVVLERRKRVGGNIETERRDGFLVDGGPDAFLRTKPHAVALCKELGLEGDLITTQARKVYVANQGELELMPGGMALAVPTRLGPMLHTPLLSWPGKIRMLGDLVRPGRSGEGDESIGDFVGRRFGDEAVDRLAAPLLGGIYAGDVRELSIGATFPQLLELERRHGSLVRGFFAAQRARTGGPPLSGNPLKQVSELWSWLKRQDSEAPSPFYSLRRGMGSLIDALVERLPQGSVRTDVAVQGVSRVGDGWVVDLEAGESLDADAVLLACPSHVASRLVPDLELGKLLEKIPYVSTATVFLGMREEDVSRDLDGVGFIVPKGEGKIMAGTWVSSKWEARAPSGSVLMRAFVGGAKSEIDVSELSDEKLGKLVHGELERLMGPLGQPLFTRVFRYEKSNPQPIVGHPQRLRRIRERAAGLPGLALAGAAYDGVGIPDCIRQGRGAADELLGHLRA